MEKSKAKYQGIIPAFYACYDKEGRVSAEKVEELTAHLVEKGVKGLYVGGSSGECIYQDVEERKLTLEHVMKAAAGKLTVIAHVACNNTRDSRELAAHAEGLGVDAIAAIPPIYFVIYNIPQLAGVALTLPLFKEMKKNPRVRAVKNSSVPVTDIQTFRMEGGDDFVVFNGPDEQLVSGLAMGADGGIGGTYGVMPELYMKIMERYQAGDMKTAMEVQDEATAIIYAMCACHGNLYAVMKEILKIRTGIDIGTVRRPMPCLVPEDMPQVEKCAGMIDAAIKKYC